jgi:hypothetical protein
LRLPAAARDTQHRRPSGRRVESINPLEFPHDDHGTPAVRTCLAADSGGTRCAGESAGGKPRIRHRSEDAQLVEGETYARSIDRHGRPASHGEDLVFRFCGFERLEDHGPSISSTFIHCTFDACEWGDALFNGAIFLGATFRHCTFRDTSILSCVFVECEFANCEFLTNSPGRSGSFDDTRWHACVQRASTGLDDRYARFSD